MNPSVTVERASILVRADFAVGKMLGQIPSAKWDRMRNAWSYPKTPSAARAIESVVSRDAFAPDAVPLLDMLDYADAARKAYLYHHGAYGIVQPLPILTTSPPWKHQLAAVRFAQPLNGCVWNIGLGAGKTRAALDLIRLRKHERVLVIAPLAVVPAWAEQAKRHVPQGWITVTALSDGSTAKRAGLATAAWKKGTPDCPAVVVVNYECAAASLFSNAASAAGLDFIVADECHRLKAPGGKQSRAIAKLGREVPYRLGLSGTLMPHSPMDAYAIYRFIDPSIFGLSFVAHRARYAIMGGFQQRQVIAYQNQEEFAARIAPITFEVNRSVLDLPEATHQERTFTLPTDAARIYRDLKTELIAALDSGVVTTSNALTRLLRLAQVASGHVGMDLAPEDLDESGRQPPRRVVALHHEKARLLEETLEEIDNDEPVVVFCRFTHDIAQARLAVERTGRSTSELSGHVNELATWQAGMSDVLVVQLQSGSEGIDLTRARYCVFWSLDYSLGRFTQALARVHRPGQSRPVSYVHLIAEGTVDRLMRRALEKRGDVIKDVLAMVRAASS